MLSLHNYDKFIVRIAYFDLKIWLVFKARLPTSKVIYFLINPGESLKILHFMDMTA